MNFINWLLHAVRSAWFLIIAWIVLVVAGATLISIWYWGWLSLGDSNGAAIRNVVLAVAAVIALPLAVWRSIVAARQSETAQHGLLNERYQKGAAMLSSAVLSVRLGGIYALARLAQDHPAQYHVSIFQLFCAFVRCPPEEAKTEQDAQKERVRLRPDVQAVMTAISGRSQAGLDYEKATRGLMLQTVSSKEGVTVRRMGHFWLDLREADLRCVDLLDAELSNANFAHADLSASILLEANLSRAQLQTVNLSRAQLWKANLSHANISQRANLSHADLTSANITEALLFWQTSPAQTYIEPT